MIDLFSLHGRTALVTGGSRGIGRMIAEGFLAQGARVYISSRKADACDKAAAEMCKIGPCISIPADISSVEGAKALAAKIAANGPLAVKVSKAVMKQSRGWAMDDRYANQGKLIGPVFVSHDAREGAAAFAEKRKPNWTGK